MPPTPPIQLVVLPRQELGYICIAGNWTSFITM